MNALLIASVVCVLISSICCSQVLVKLPVSGITSPGYVVLPGNDHITNLVTYTGQYYEFELLSTLRKFHRQGVYVDVGAHYGNHVTFFARECPSTLVVAIEANPVSYDGLRYTIAANDLQSRVLALNVAIHPSWLRSKVVSYETEGHSNTGMFRITEADHNTAAAVPAMRLDDILLPLSNIAVIKIDAEGSDHLVLQSAVRILQRDRPIVAVETQTDEYMQRIRDVLQPLGYRIVAEAGHGFTPMFIWASE